MTTIQKARFLLKIKLMHTKIPVWRSFYVPSNISLCRLHIAIQMVMGWRNSHMHEFKFGKLIFLPNNAFADATSENTLPEGNLKLNTFVTKKRIRLFIITIWVIIGSTKSRSKMLITMREKRILCYASTVRELVRPKMSVRLRDLNILQSNQ